MQACGYAVEIVEPGAHACYFLGAVVVQLLHAVDQFHHQLIDALETLLLARAFFADLEDLALGLIQHGADLTSARVEGTGRDVIAGRNQLAQDAAFTNDLGVTPHVRGAGNALRQRVQVGQAAHVLRLAQALKLLEDGDDVRWFALAHQHTDGGVDQAVFVAVEIAVGQQVTSTVPSQVVQQQATQHALFCFYRMRRHTQAGHLVVAGAERFTGVEDRGHGGWSTGERALAIQQACAQAGIGCG